MKNADGEPVEERLADALAAYDDRLAAGITRVPEETQPVVDPALLPDWNRLTAFLSLVEKAWPRGSQSSDDVAAGPENRRPGPPLHEETSGEANPAPAPDDDRRFGRFQIVRTLGQGGFGIVFLAWDPAHRRHVALKVPQPETFVTLEARKRFQREAQAAAGLDHPNIVPVYEAGTVGSVSYIAAAYCPGPTLAGWLASQAQPVPAREAATLVATLAWAVDHAHGRGVLHRDLKPSNILLMHTAAHDSAPHMNEPLRAFEPRITDFSLAKFADGLASDTKSGIPVGSPPYMAPEQAEGNLKAIGPQTDVYGLGCILYELLTGAAPFRGESQLDTLRQVIANAPIPPRRLRKDTPVELEAIALKCLEKDPARRFAIARELAEDLERFLADLPTRSRPSGILSRAWRWLIRPQRIGEAGMIAMVYATLSLVWLFYAVIFVRLGFVSHLARPSEFYRDTLIVICGDFIPAFWLGWKIRQRRPWAIWAGQVMAIERLCILTAGLFGMPPRFGGFYDNVVTRTAIYIALINLALSVLVSNAMALVAYYANRDSIRSGGNPAGWGRQKPSRRPAAPAPAEYSSGGADGEPGRPRPSGRRATPGRSVERPLAAVVVVAMAVLVAVTAVNVNRSYNARLEQARQTARQHESDAREHETLARRIKYIADIRQAAQLVSNDLAHCALDLLERYLPQPGRNDPRGFAWSHLARRCFTANHSFSGHDGDVYHAEFSPDDRLIASSGKDGTVRLWDVKTGACLKVLKAHSSEINWVAFSPDGKSLATTCDDGTVGLRDIAGQRPPVTIHAHEGEASIVLFTPDGKNVISCGRADALVKTWNATTGEPIHAFQGDTGILENMALSAGGSHLAVTGNTGLATLWLLPAGARVTKLGPHPNHVDGLAFNRQGDMVATGCADGVVRLWNTRRALLVREYKGHTRGLHAVAFTPDDRTLISAGGDLTIRIWDVATGNLRGLHMGHRDRIWGVAISHDGQMIVSASRDGKVMLWSTAPPAVPTRLSAPELPRGLAFATDNRSITLAGSGGLISRWDAKSAKPLENWRLEGPSPLSDLVMDERGTIAVACQKNGSMQIHDLIGRRHMSTTAHSNALAPAIVLNHDGRRMALIEPDHRVSLWNPATMTRLGRLDGNIGRVLIAPTGDVYASADTGKSLIIWDPERDRKRVIPGLDWQPYHFACLSDDGASFASCRGNVIGLWWTGDFHKAGFLPGHKHDITTLAFSPDRTTLASGDEVGTVKLWDVATQELLLTLENHAGPVRFIRFSPDGKVLATCAERPGGTTEIFLWQTVDGDLVQRQRPQASAPARSSAALSGPLAQHSGAP